MIDNFTLAEITWGFHPIYWPRPPLKMPRWWQFRIKDRLRDLEDVFGPLDQAALDRYHAEARKGQSVYEDVGGYILRCYQAMAGEVVDEPYRYSDAIIDLAERRGLRG